MKRLSGLVALVLVLGAAPAGAAARGPLRIWGGMRIRSLDPGRPRPAHTAHAAHTARLLAVTAARTGRSRPRANEVLSNERTYTRWSYVDRIAFIHRRPWLRSRRLSRLTWYTEDGFPSVYVLLRAHWDTRGREWVKLRIPGRPNGRTGWVERNALGRFHLTHRLLVVSRRRLRVSLFVDGRRLWSAPAGVGKPSTPTPAGHFWINERFRIEDPQSGYWPYAFGTTDYSTLSNWPGGGVVGIHGPYYAAALIPGRISHGCVRLRVSADAWLARHLELGTPVHVM
ncbi:MAG TPA: L,D-transpeptidase [Solirubrobacteraceae bacterium]|nr:L,D-transpeptidase [Solirubrobacteraceae bacterium]